MYVNQEIAKNNNSPASHAGATMCPCNIEFAVGTPSPTFFSLLAPTAKDPRSLSHPHSAFETGSTQSLHAKVPCNASNIAFYHSSISVRLSKPFFHHHHLSAATQSISCKGNTSSSPSPGSPPLMQPFPTCQTLGPAKSVGNTRDPTGHSNLRNVNVLLKLSLHIRHHAVCTVRVAAPYDAKRLVSVSTQISQTNDFPRLLRFLPKVVLQGLNLRTRISLS